jgi:hypothetical protein
MPSPSGSYITNYLKNKYQWEQNFARARELAALDGVPQTQWNSYEHAYFSAWLQFKYSGGPSGGSLAHDLGDGLELAAYLNWLTGGADNRADSYKDLWNNNIGRQIGEYARQNGLGLADIERLLREAFQRGDLIKDLFDDKMPTFGWGGTPFEFDNGLPKLEQIPFRLAHIRRH